MPSEGEPRRVKIDGMTRMLVISDEHYAEIAAREAEREREVNASFERVFHACGGPEAEQFEVACDHLFTWFNSYQKLPELLFICDLLEPTVWLKLLGECWSSCDAITPFADELREETPLGYLLEGGRRGTRRAAARNLLMDEAEREAFDRLPRQVKIYRGCYDNNRDGLSWSLDRDRAAKFPTYTRFYQRNGQPILVEAIARRTKVAAIKLSRNEAEIITSGPTVVSITPLPMIDPFDWLKEPIPQ
jgi:hypothetical protein